MIENWIGYSEELLSEVEYRILSNLKTPYKTFHVPIALDGVEEKIWTISLNRDSKNTPLVLLHGFAIGIGLWCLNLDELSKHRPVYAMDIIGHSMGGYLATSYTLSYPGSVKLLILCDPWGFSDKFEYPPLWIKILVYIFECLNFNPVGFLRSLGPFGPLYLRLTRDDVNKHFKGFLKDPCALPTYIYQCNAHPNPTGETAFYSFLNGMWAKNPMIRRVNALDIEVPMKIIYGSHTWMDKNIGPRIKEMRPNSCVGVQIIDNSGHHIYADQAEIFNDIVNNTCNLWEKEYNVKSH